MTQYMRIPSEEPESDGPAPAYLGDQQTAGSSRAAELSDHEGGKNGDEGEQFVMLPPPYGDNNDLPTYEEVERIKRDEEDRDNENPYSALLNGAVTANLFNSELEVGSDSIFLLTFLIALMFSWVGFMLTFCVSNSLAGRYGAISGFGLSLIKWTVLVSHSQYAGEQTTYWFNAWVSWLLIMSGGMIFIRGIYLYVRAKQRAYSSAENQSSEESNSEERPTARQLSLFYFY